MNFSSQSLDQKGPLHLRDINRARQFYNPLVGLDMPRLRALLEQGERGLNSQLQDLYRIAEKRHSTLLALKTRRVGEVKKLDWDIKIPARLPRGITAGQAEAQANFLRDAYDRIGNLPTAFEFQAGASFRGYSHLEKHYEDNDPNLPVVKLQPVPQWHMLRSQETWDWVYDATARNNASQGVPIDPANFITREVEAPLNEIGAITFLRSSIGEKDWPSFIEDFGLPSIFASLAPNTPLDKVKEWLAVVEKVTGNSRGALPPGAEVTTLDAAMSDGAAFEKYLAHQDQVLVLAGTCGLLTMLTAPGSGTLAGSAHQEAFNMIALAEAREISAVFQTQFDQPLLAREFPSQRPAAYFELAALDEEDLDAIAKRLQLLAAAGLIADAKEISEKLGITLERGNVTIAAGKPGAGGDNPGGGDGGGDALKNRTPADPSAVASAKMDAGAAVFNANATRQLSAAQVEAVQPLLDRIAAWKTVPEAEFPAVLQKFGDELPRMFAEARLHSPDIAGVWADVLSTAMADGMGQRPAKKEAKPAA